MIFVTMLMMLRLRVCHCSDDSMSEYQGNGIIGKIHSCGFVSLL